MSRFKVINALLCDHASVSSGNKHTLVNVYSGDLLLGEIPANIMLSAYLELLAPVSGTMDLKVSYKLNSKPIASINAHAEGLVKGALGVLVLPSIPMAISSTGILTLEIEAPGSPKSIVIKKNVMVGPQA